MSPSLPLSKNSFDTFLSLRKLLKFGQVWLKFGVVSEIRATHGEHPRSDKRDGYWEDMSSCIGQSPRYSPGKRILEEWYDCIYIFVDCGWQKMKKSKSCVIGGCFHRGRGRVSRFENEPVKNSITRVEGTRRVQRRKWGRVFWLIGPRGNRLEIGYYYPVNAVTVATNRTFNHLRYRTPRDEIAFHTLLPFFRRRSNLSCSISPHDHCFSFVNLHFLPCPTLHFRYELRTRAERTLIIDLPPTPPAFRRCLVIFD